MTTFSLGVPEFISSLPVEVRGFVIGALFGAFLFWGGLADPDKIVGTLRLKDFHAMRTIAVFLLVGMLGTWILDTFGAANFSIKPAAIYSILIGGILLGVGFGLTGYCPGTGLACAVSGRLDALVTVLGMFVGALAFILIHPVLALPLDKAWNEGKVRIPEVAGGDPAVWVLAICGGIALILVITYLVGRGRKVAAE